MLLHSVHHHHDSGGWPTPTGEINMISSEPVFEIETIQSMREAQICIWGFRLILPDEDATQAATDDDHQRAPTVTLQKARARPHLHPKAMITP